MALFSTSEIKEYQLILDKTPAGQYLLKKIFSEIWSDLNPTIFGRNFYETYEKSLFSNVKFVKTKTDNHHLYEISRSSN